MQSTDTGQLVIAQNIKLHRRYFKEFVRLHGIKTQFYKPKEGTKIYNLHTELVTDFEEPTSVWAIYDEHPNQKSMRKLGWNAELADSSVVIHGPEDLNGLQNGAVFEIPAGIDNAEPRRFRVLRMQNIAVYPASVTCELAPELKTTLPNDIIHDYKNSNFNLLKDEAADYE